jgi:hypothetical protein
MHTETEPIVVYPLSKQHIDREVAIIIHDAIHNEDIHKVNIPNEQGIWTDYPITLAANGCRQIIYNQIRFIEQNKKKSTKFAMLANEGHQITWGIRDTSKWIYIFDRKIL